MILYTWDGFLREYLEFPEGSLATCFVWWGSRDGYGVNAREIGLISIWFWLHWAILHSWGDSSVLLILWQCCWGLSGVQSSKSWLLTSWLGKRNCSGHNAGASGLISRWEERLMGFHEVRQEPGVYSRVTAGISIRNWSLFSKVRTPDYLWETTQECKLGVALQYGRFWKLSGSSCLFFYLTQWYWDS